MLTNETIADIIKDFLALVIISDFDDYFFAAVSNTPMGRLIKDGEIETSNGTLYLKDVLMIHCTTSLHAQPDLKIPHVLERKLEEAPHKEMVSRDYQARNYTTIERPAVLTSEQRDKWLKLARLIYRIIDMFYQVFWFYFAPFSALFCSYLVPYQLGGYDNLE